MGDNEERIGFIAFELGKSYDVGEYGGRYESLKLKLTKQLPLQSGLVVPPSSIKLMRHQSSEGAERHDYVKVADPLWKEASLSDALPTEWFMNGHHQ